MAIEDDRRRVAALLDDVANGLVSTKEALARTEEWKEIPWQDRVFADAYHALQHYDADSDIRANDAEYAAAQARWLRSFAEKLRKAV